MPKKTAPKKTAPENTSITIDGKEIDLANFRLAQLKEHDPKAHKEVTVSFLKRVAEGMELGDDDSPYARAHYQAVEARRLADLRSKERTAGAEAALQGRINTLKALAEADNYINQSLADRAKLQQYRINTALDTAAVAAAVKAATAPTDAPLVGEAVALKQVASI